MNSLLEAVFFDFSFLDKGSPLKSFGFLSRVA